jgi:hypothetical protein
MGVTVTATRPTFTGGRRRYLQIRVPIVCAGSQQLRKQVVGRWGRQLARDTHGLAVHCLYGSQRRGEEEGVVIGEVGHCALGR